MHAWRLFDRAAQRLQLSLSPRTGERRIGGKAPRNFLAFFQFGKPLGNQRIGAALLELRYPGLGLSQISTEAVDFGSEFGEAVFRLRAAFAWWPTAHPTLACIRTPGS